MCAASFPGINIEFWELFINNGSNTGNNNYAMRGILFPSLLRNWFWKKKTFKKALSVGKAVR